MKHKHHIIPRHAGGTDNPDNLVELTVAEHAEAHRQLYEKYGRVQDRAAWLGLSGLADKKEIYQLLLESRRGVPLKPEVIAKISESLKGRSVTWGDKISKKLQGRENKWAVGNTWAAALSGVPKSEEHKKKISESKKGKPRPDMVGNKLAAGSRQKTLEHQEKITAALNSAETKNKIKLSWAEKDSVICPHCGMTGKAGHNMKRYHFDNCKRKT